MKFLSPKKAMISGKMWVKDVVGGVVRKKLEGGEDLFQL